MLELTDCNTLRIFTIQKNRRMLWLVHCNAFHISAGVTRETVVREKS